MQQPSLIDSAQIAHNRGLSPVDYLRERGYVQDITDETALRAAFERGVLTTYIGFDPTAPSLHVGHLLGIMMLASLQRFGHRPIALAGGGTTMVGDPSGKTSARAVLEVDTIQQNLKSIVTQFDRYIDFAGGRFGDSSPAALLVNNADWLLQLRYIEFLRDIGRHFSVNEMLAAETYRQRLETTGLNFVEFNYRIVQAYDFLHLFRTHGCSLQMGGSDQWGNIVAGVDLIRRVESKEAFGLVVSLLTTSSGQKMGKSEGNSVWLDPIMTTPYDYFQYWVNVEDLDVARFMRLYTFLPEEQIVELTSVEGEALREAKRVLAFETTKLTHGEAAALESLAAANVLFARSNSTGSEGWADDPNLPTTKLLQSDLQDGFTVADLFIKAGLTTSRGETRRLAEQGGLSINDQKIENVDSPAEIGTNPMLLRVGKKRFRRVVFA